MLIVMPITAVAMRAESLFTTEVVESKRRCRTLSTSRWAS
jgi:hypothetical protein